MGITSALVLYAVIWFMLLFITLPIGITTQGDVGEKVRGTQAGAPVSINLKKRFRWISAGAFVAWLIIGGIIISGVITVCDFDWFGTMSKVCEARALPQ